MNGGEDAVPHPAQAEPPEVIEHRLPVVGKSLYGAVIALVFVFGKVVLLSGLNEPVVLLVITAVLNGVTSFVYCALLIQLNRFMLPDRIKMGNARLAVMSFAVAFYGFFFIVTVLNLFGIVG